MPSGSSSTMVSEVDRTARSPSATGGPPSAHARGAARARINMQGDRMGHLRPHATQSANNSSRKGKRSGANLLRGRRLGGRGGGRLLGGRLRGLDGLEVEAALRHDVDDAVGAGQAGG